MSLAVAEENIAHESPPRGMKSHLDGNKMYLQPSIAGRLGCWMTDPCHRDSFRAFVESCFAEAHKTAASQKIATAGAGVRQLKQSALPPISISTPSNRDDSLWWRLWFAGDWTATMAGKAKTPTLGQIQDALRAHSFEVTESAGTLRAAKYGCAVVLVASQEVGRELGTATGTETVVAYRERPGAVIGGEI